MEIVKPVLWTIISIFALYIGFNTTGSKLYIFFFMFAAIACVALQWILYFKKGRKK